ncbi:phosphoenolpyruvate synthase [Candidatus Pacearchaeota archaeon]|nr:phosphoenolpyruvate synthase [Candidatus Pacearchaeota archaeon]
MAIKKKIEVPSEQYIRWLSELSKDSGAIVGGKGANLAEMYNARFPVPPAFCVTAQAFDIFLKKAGLKDKIVELINKTNVDNTEELEKNSAKIRELVANADMPEDMQQEIEEAYNLLGSDNKDEFDSKSKEMVFVAVRSSATTEDLAGASFAGQQETFTNVKGNKELIKAVRKCFASLYTARAVYYRHKKGFDKANALLSVVVQKMVNSDRSGVMFTKNPTNADNEIIIEAVFGLGEGIVSGKILPDHYVLNDDLELKEKRIADKKVKMIKEENGNGITVKLDKEESKKQVLTLQEISTLGSLGQRIENHYKHPQDIEFAVENGKVYIVQSRPITTLEQAKLEKEKNNEKVTGNVLLTGLPASPGMGFGKVKIVLDMKDLGKVQKGDILVTKMTNPDMVVTMQRATGVITDEGGATSHAAIVSREMGIPCVVGTEKATETLKDGQEITVDGTNGKVYSGKPKKIELIEKKEIQQIVKTKTKIKVMVDLPHFAERAAKSGCEAVGLMRLEGIIAESGKHPLGFLKENKCDEYSLIIEKGIREISKHFKEVWIRTSDIRSDEYKNLKGAPKELELNPMLGFHGIRFSLKNPEIFEAELQAIANVASENPEKRFGVMFPQIISIQEVEEAYKIFKKYQKKNMIIGAMIETPAAVQIIKEICKYIKFISFGTNDLTQYTLAVDRGNSECQYLYNEMHPAILSQLKKVIMVCKEYKVESSICGQAGSKKEMVEFLVKQGIDSISVNADVARDISLFVQELESNRIIEKDLNSNNSNKNMAKSKILPIDDTREIEKDIDEKKGQVLKEKVKKENKNKDTTEIVKETPKDKEEKKSEEFPEFEIGFDPFQQQ